MEKKCVVWGTREAGRRLAHQAEKVGYSVVAYCSSTKDSQGKQINGRPVAVSYTHLTLPTNCT